MTKPTARCSYTDYKGSTTNRSFFLAGPKIARIAIFSRSGTVNLLRPVEAAEHLNSPESPMKVTARPELIVHADWSIEPRKRWMASARRDETGTYVAAAAEAVGNTRNLMSRVREEVSPSGCALLGFDFPIGLPGVYAAATGISNFRTFLAEIGRPAWRDFFLVATKPEEISLHRPFYPQRSGKMIKQEHLTHALGVADIDALRRQCERRHVDRRAACPLFWTLGGQQVGKAAISGWREIIVPAIQANDSGVRLWPFDGPLESLLVEGAIVLSETYPAEFYRHLGVMFPPSRPKERTGKRVKADRAMNASTLLSWAASASVGITNDLRAEIEDGFGDSADGEDRFDAVVGLFGMINIVLGNRAEGSADDKAVVNVEGWILGQTYISSSRPEEVSSAQPVKSGAHVSELDRLRGLLLDAINALEEAGATDEALRIAQEIQPRQ